MASANDDAAGPTAREPGKPDTAITDTDLTDIFDVTVRVETRLWALVEQRLEEGDAISVTSYDVLRTLLRLGTCRPGDIAAHLGITSGGMTKVLDRMERDGLLERQPNEQDRRSSLIAVTPAGRRAFDKAQPLVEATMREVMARSGRSSIEIASLREVLDALNEALGDAPTNTRACPTRRGSARRA
ncbi:MAG: MarR family transcriptional regulator [Pseudoscardovia radai]|nr:MarR family transcriptional regulator [Pseudoscardovia radai]